MTQLIGLKMASREEVTDYLTKAEGLKLDLAEAGEVVSDAQFTAMILKSLVTSTVWCQSSTSAQQRGSTR